MKDKIEKHKIDGKVYTWKYLENSKNYPGWNFTVDKTASGSLVELLNLMKQCEWSSRKEIQISKPTENQIKVPNNQNGSAKWKTVSKLILTSKKTAEKEFWKVMEKENEIEIQFGENKLVDFEKAISEIPKGIGDFAITSDSEDNILYLWWNSES
jgi:hypothetical protein